MTTEKKQVHHFAHFHVIGLFCLLILLVSGGVFAQKPESRNLQNADRGVRDLTVPADSVMPGRLPESPEGDSLTFNFSADTTLSDSAATADSSARKGDIETTVKYSAEDSIFFDVFTNRVLLYGNAQVEYGKIKLTAAQIIIDWKANLLWAKGVEDSAGAITGAPVFQDGGDKYSSKEMLYNYKSKKGRISGLLTKQGEGYIKGETVKKMPDNTMYVANGRFCPCDDPEAGTYIKAYKIKMQNRKIYTGPAQLFIAHIPTPLVLPFGVFPSQDRRSSGVLIPTYGESVDRGFFLRGGGFYFAVSENLGLRATGSIYTKGGYGLDLAGDYKQRYAYNGQFLLSYNKRVNEILGEVQPLEQNDYWVTWSHRPEAKGRSSRLTANVNFGSSSYNRNNSRNVNNYLNQNFTSNVAYTKVFKGTPFNLGVNLRQNQNITTGVANYVLPDVNFSMNRQTPFSNISGGRWTEPVRKLNYAYNLTFQNTLTNQTRTADGRDTVVKLNNEAEIINRLNTGMKHSIPIGTSVKLLKFFSLNPTFSYDEVWYLRQLDYRWNDQTGKLVTDTIDGFSRAGTWSTSANLTTRIYGTFFVRKAGIEAVRHTMIPTVGFNYRPDFSEPKYGYYQYVQTDTLGTITPLSIYQGFINSPSFAGRSANLTFSLNNNFEMKVRNRKDTTDDPKNKFKKVNILDNVAISSAYNLIADSFNLSNPSLTARTVLFKNLNINFVSTYDPYRYRLDSTRGETVYQRRLPVYGWEGLNPKYTREGSSYSQGGFSSYSVALSTNLNPKAAQKREIKSDKYSEEELEAIKRNYEMYVDFSLPWSLRLNYNYNYSKQGFAKSNVTQSLSFSGDVSVTEKWKVQYNSGWDFTLKTLTYTSLNIYRDLGCWEMRINWVPFGFRQSYSVDINVKPAILKDLKLSRRRDWYDR